MPTLRSLDLHARLRLARMAAQKAGDIMMAHYDRPLDIRTKSSVSDLVTQVDLECDQLIRELIGEEAPEDTLITEETFEAHHEINLSSAWIVDPVDGTTNYAHAFPHFAVSIAYVQDGVIKVGVIFDPFKNEMFTAVADEPAYRNGVPIRVSEQTDIQRSLLATGFPYDRNESPENNIDLYARFLTHTHGIRRAGAAALDLAYVACGRLDGFWELKLSPWDVAAGALIVQQAGGTVTNFHGDPLVLNQKRVDIIASTSGIHKTMVDVIQNR